jgi:hypothetical protein
LARAQAAATPLRPTIVASHNDNDVIVVKLKRAGDVRLGPCGLSVAATGSSTARSRPIVRLLLIESAGMPKTGNPATAAVKTRI